MFMHLLATLGKGTKERYYVEQGSMSNSSRHIYDIHM